MTQQIVRIAAILFIIASLGTTFLMITSLEEAEARTYHECYGIVYHTIPVPPYVFPVFTRWEVRHDHLYAHSWDACSS